MTITLKDIQRHVGVPDDGRWGPATMAAVARKLGLVPAPAPTPSPAPAPASGNQLSANFTLAELTFSRTAHKRGIDNTPPAAAVAALRALAVNVLQPVRNHFGRPVVVTSGYRSPALNRAIGGSATSQHSLGEAADFTVSGVSNLEVARWIAANVEFDQLIYEFGETGWLHVSYRAGRLRKQVLRAVKQNGRTVYLAGLPG
jgi:zinc D-Ala-D-Ala carboxypeptidase